jgi:regulatory protein
MAEVGQGTPPTPRDQPVERVRWEGKRPTATRLETRQQIQDLAMRYIARFSTTRAALGKHLNGKVDDSARVHGTDRSEGRRHVESVLDRLCELRYLDDAAWAESRVRTLVERGRSPRAIRRALADKGIAEPLADAALEARAAEDDGDGGLVVQAARNLARRRRLGPYRRGSAPDAAGAQRELAVLARAGFPFDVARKVLAEAPAEGDPDGV